MDNYWSLGKWGGIPVSMHWTVLLAFPFLYLSFMSFVAAFVGLFAFGFLLALHEAGHVLVARWRGVYVEEIKFYLLHGHTSLGLRRSERDEVFIAWGGIVLQLLVLLLVSVVTAAAGPPQSEWAALILGPIWRVLTIWNIFLILVALLPIGPMDGRTAWKLFPMLGKSLRPKRPPAPKAPAHDDGEPKLTPRRQRELEESSRKAAAEIIENLGKNRQK